MHFGFKTTPQNTTWPAMLELWRAADEAARYAALGAGLAIVYLKPPYDPAVLEPLAVRLGAW